MSSTPGILATVVALGAVMLPSKAEAAEIRCTPFVHPLAGPTEVTVIATDIASPGDELRVLQDQNDVTAIVVQSATIVTADDVDQNGVYESFARRYTLDLSVLAFDRPMLMFEATTIDAQGTPATVSRSMTMVDPIHLGTGVTSWVSSANGTVARFYLRIEGAALQSKSIAVFKNGQNVTPSAALSERIVWDTTRDGFVLDRMYEIQVDLPSFGFGQVGDELQLRVDGLVLNGQADLMLSIGSPVVVEVDPTAEQIKCNCVKNCVQAFTASANVSTSGGVTTVGAPPEDVASAAAALEACLKACGMTSGTKLVSIPGVGPVIVGIGKADGAAALVVVVGTPGAISMGGGDATAENTEPGGAAIAVGGAGGGGATTGGVAKATSGGGDSVAVGGSGGKAAGGGSGGNGGSADAENKNQGGTAKAQGGDGGKPDLGPGGNGGPAKVKAGEPVVGPMPGGSGVPGKYGTGGKASLVNGQPGGGPGGTN